MVGGDGERCWEVGMNLHLTATSRSNNDKSVLRVKLWSEGLLSPSNVQTRTGYTTHPFLTPATFALHLCVS